MRARLGVLLIAQTVIACPATARAPDLDEPIVTGANNIGWRSAAPPIETESVAAATVASEAAAIVAGHEDPPSPAPRAQDAVVVLTPIQGPLMVEGRYVGDISGEVSVDGQGVVDSARLLALLQGIVSDQTLQGLRDRIGGRDRAAFSSLTMEGFSIAFDTFSLAFTVTLGAEARARRQLNFGRAENIDPAAFDQPARFSAAANVSVGQTYDHASSDFRGLRGAADLLVNMGGFGGVTLTTGFDYDEDSGGDRLRRREIRLTKDLFKSAIRLTAGEFSPTITGFQGADRILGVSAGRAYSVIRPFQNIRPSGRREFVLERPSFVEVEVNGVVVERLQLEPGPYSLSDFPFGQGANTVRFIADDPSGRREIAVFDLYGGAGLLDQGLVDFGLSAGVLQEGGEFRYEGTPAVSGFVRKGLTDSLSAGVSGQWVDDRWLVETAATWGSAFGLIDLSIAASGNPSTDRTGFAAAFDYLHEISLFEADDTRVVVTAEVFSRDFQDPFERTAVNPEAWRLAGQVSTRWDRYTINVGAAFIDGRGAQSNERSMDLAIGRSFGRYGISASLGYRDRDDREAETRFGLALTVGLGRRWNAQARYESDQDYREVVLRRSSSGELGDVSGGLRVTQDDGRDTIGGDIRYINNRFDAELISNRLSSRAPGGQTSQESLWRVSSLLAFADGTFGVGRPGREGFVLARRHKSLAGSTMALTDGNGRQIARAGLFGPAVVPIDRAYSPQRFELKVDPLPNGYDLGDGLISVFPGFGNGYSVMVGSDASRTALGFLLDEEGAPRGLVSGTIEAETPGAGAPEPRPFFTNRSGRFIGDGLAPGRYRLVVQGRTIGVFTIPEESEGVVDVGRIQTTRP